MNHRIFHLAFPAHDLAQARHFHIEGQGFAARRNSPSFAFNW